MNILYKKLPRIERLLNIFSTVVMMYFFFKECPSFRETWWFRDGMVSGIGIKIMGGAVETAYELVIVQAGQ